MITCVDMFDFHDYGKVLSCRSQQNGVRWDFHSLVRAIVSPHYHLLPHQRDYCDKSDCCKEENEIA